MLFFIPKNERTDIVFNKKKSTKELVGGKPVEDKPSKKPKREKPKKAEKLERKPRLDWKAVLRSKYLWGSLSIVAALLLTFVVVPMQQRKAATLSSVVVLARDVSVGQQITADMLSTVEMGMNGIPAGAITDSSAAIGLYVTTDGLKGDVLTMARLSSEYPTDDPFLLNLSEGKLAMAVSLSASAQNVASKLRAGDLIQLIAVLSDTDSDTGTQYAQLQYVEILGVTDSEAVDLVDGDNFGEKQKIETVILAVNEEQAALLAGLESKSTLYAALVSRGDDERKTELLAEQERYFEEVGK